MDPAYPQILSNPFPGLRPFESHENHLFFGRDGQSNELLRKLRKTHFLAVVGTSGSGKSSLVKAGLLPDLYSGMMAGSNTNWRIAVFRPGGNPLANMAKALSVPGVLIDQDNPEDDLYTQEQFIRITLERSALGLVEAYRQAKLSERENLLVVVDQFEELFRFVNNSTEPNARDQAGAFVKLLLSSVEDKSNSIYIVITMRSDYLGDCSSFRDLPETINEGQYLIPRMTRNQRREAINGPVAVGGATITPQLVQRLLNDVGSNPDQLPIMQHALMRTWDFWKERNEPDSPIELSDYTAIGGIDQALSLHADKALNDVIDGLSDEASAKRKQVVEKLFKFLTEKGPDNREIRRQASVADIITHTGAELEELVLIIEVFRKPGYSFLVPPKQEIDLDTVIDISHESLIRQWETLKYWVDEEAESSKIFLRLVESAQQYYQNKKDLLFGLELDQYIVWRASSKPDHAWAGRYSSDCDRCLKYLDDSVKQRDRVEKEARRQAAIREQRRRKELRRARVFASILALATLISISFLIYASYQRKQALIQRDIAQANYQISEAQLQADKDPTIALRMSERAIQTQSSPLVLNAAHQIYRGNVFYKSLAHDAEVNAVAFSPDNSLMLTGCQDGVARVWNTKSELQLEIAVGQPVNAVAFGPHEDRILIASNDGSVVLYNLEGKLLQEFNHAQPVSSVTFSPDGKYLLTGSEKARLWDLKGNQLVVFGQNQISSLAFSPDGRSVLTAYYDKNAELWDINGNSSRKFGDDSDYIYSVAFSPDGHQILTGSVDGIAKVWDITGILIEEFDFHSNRISSVAFWPKGDKIVTGSYDHLVVLFDLNTDQYIELKGHQNRISSVAVSADGSKVLSGSYDGTARIWQQQGQLIDEFEAHDEYILSVDFSPDGSKLLTGSYDQTAKLWAPDGVLLAEITGHHDQVNSVVFSPDGGKILTGSGDGTILLTDLTGKVLHQFNNHLAAVTSVDFSPDGTKIIVGSADSTARCWSLEGDLLLELNNHQDRVSSVSFSPDGSMLLTASWDSLARLWNSEGVLITEFSGHQDQVHTAVFSSDGSQVLTGSGDGSIRIWSLTGKLVKEIRTPGIVSTVAVSSDRSRILSVNVGNSVMLWDLDGNLLKEYSGQMVSAAFSPDGNRILAGSGGIVQLWNEVMTLERFLQSDKIDRVKLDAAR
ncbi:MAG: hypothetical protein DHS20C17_23270 [Cyclobacteriaceae bacterium]|nr:MAG: hypothetical protein DHS20C17_23270 [Cyclobacteriaceae bacterium]